MDVTEREPQALMTPRDHGPRDGTAAREDGESAELVERAQRGETAAFAELVERHRAGLERFVEVRLGSHLRGWVDREDVVQETLSRALRSVCGFEFRGGKSFRRWLETIAEHVILEGTRREGRRPTALEVDLPASAASPSRVARREERFDRLDEAFAVLSEDHRQVILLARIEGLKIQEIARRMRRSPDAVKKLLSRALKALKNCFGDTESFHLPERRLNVRGPRGPEEGCDGPEVERP